MEAKLISIIRKSNKRVQLKLLKDRYLDMNSKAHKNILQLDGSCIC